MPKPKVPTALKILKGTDQPCRMNPDEPMPSTENIEMPDDLSIAAQEKWHRFVKILKDCRVMTVADVEVLRLLCEGAVMFARAAQSVNDQGMIIRVEGQPPYINPAIKLMKQAQDQVMPALRELGMTPAARTKVSAVGKKKDASKFTDI